MLTDKIRLLSTIPSSEEDPENIFSSCLAVIFPDDITNHHGDATSSVQYLSPLYGPLSLSLCDPSGSSRSLFSHFLWNAGLQLAEFIESGSDDKGRDWEVQGKRVLELGAGTGLAGMVAGLGGAKDVIISDYPAPEVLANIQANVDRNIVPVRKKLALLSGGSVAVEGHKWGILRDSFAMANEGMFDRLLVADCLWMPWQHGNLQRSIAHFLALEGRAWIVAGFHTGREKMRGFYEERGLKEAGLEVESIWERNAEGLEREWVMDRGIEDVTKTERKRWLVVAVLKRTAG